MNVTSPPPSPIALENASSVEAYKRPRVLLISHAYVTGVNQGKLAAIADTQEAEVGLIAPTQWRAVGWRKRLKLETPYDNIRVYPVNIRFSGRVGAFFYQPWQAWQAIQDFKPDLLHVEQEVFSVAAMEFGMIARITGIPMVVFGWENLNRQLSWPRRWLRRYVLDTVPAIVAGNEDGAQLLRQWGYRNKIEVMPQIGVDAQLFAPPDPRPSRNNRAFRVGFMGRLTYQKGLDTLFAAVKLCRDRGCNLRLLMCGSGQDEAELKADAERQGIDNITDWLGSVPHAEVPLKMNEFDLLVLPSKTGKIWKEQFGHVLIEAMCLGIPTIGSSSGEIPHVIGRSDLVFPEGDASALATIVQRAIQDPDWYAEIERYGLERVHRLYTHERIAKRLLKLWQGVLANPIREQ